jgi:type IX secretion system PorP/SprF family membrane protein
LKYILRILFFLVSTISLAQQDPQFSQYMMNPLMWNPSYSALNNDYMLSLHHRTQWIGYTPSNNSDNIQAPSSQLFTFSTPLRKIRSGLGLGVLNDRIGPINSTNAFLSYSYGIKLGEGKLAAGVGFGIHSSQINTSLWRPENPNDNTLNAGNSGSINQIKPNFRLGLGYTRDNFFLGLSVNNITTPTFTYSTDVISSQLERHYYFQGSYKIFLSESVSLQPSAIGKMTKSITSFEVSNLVFVKNFWLGLAYRTSDAATFLAGINLLPDKSLKVGYNLDLNVINISAKALTSHEIFLSYNLSSFLDNKKPIVRSPRFRY